MTNFFWSSAPETKKFFQCLRLSLHTTGERFVEKELLSVESLRQRGEPFSNYTTEILVEFLSYMDNLWELEKKGDFYRVTSKCVQVQRHLNALSLPVLDAMKANFDPNGEFFRKTKPSVLPASLSRTRFRSRNNRSFASQHFLVLTGTFVLSVEQLAAHIDVLAVSLEE